MKINGKTQAQRIHSLMDELFENDGQLTTAGKLCQKHNLSPRLISFMQRKGIISRNTKRGAIYWQSKKPDLDMAILTSREFNNQERQYRKGLKEKRPVTNGFKAPEKTIGYRIHFLGMRFTIRRPKVKIEKLTS